jgi:hypothetical protein
MLRHAAVPSCAGILCCAVPGMWLTKFKETAYVVMQEPGHAHATRKKLQVRTRMSDGQHRVVRQNTVANYTCMVARSFSTAQ